MRLAFHSPRACARRNLVASADCRPLFVVLIEYHSDERAMAHHHPETLLGAPLGSPTHPPSRCSRRPVFQAMASSVWRVYGKPTSRTRFLPRLDGGVGVGGLAALRRTRGTTTSSNLKPVATTTVADHAMPEFQTRPRRSGRRRSSWNLLASVPDTLFSPHLIDATEGASRRASYAH